MTGTLRRKRLRQASEMVALGRLEEAEERLVALVTPAPDFAVAWLELGRVRLARGKSLEAFEAFGKAAHFVQTAAEARMRLGRLARPGPGDHLRARNFKIALLVDPTHAAALTDLADLTGGKVLGWYAAAITSSDIDTDPLRELINRGWNERALRLAKIAAVTRPTPMKTQRWLASIVFRREDFEGNARFLKQAAVCSPGDFNAQIDAVDALFRIDAYDLAETYAERALMIDGAAAPALFWLGRIQRRLGRFSDARARFAETLRADENFGLRVNVVEQGVHPGDFEP